MAETFRIEGLADLEAALIGLREEFDLSRSTAKNTIKRALTDAAEPIRSDAEARAPVLSGTLQASVIVSTKLSRRQKSQNKMESPVEVYVGPGPLPQAITQEFGAAQHGPQPFMRPAFDTNKMSVMNSLKDAIAAQIEKTRARLARKAEREAAKIKAGV